MTARFSGHSFQVFFRSFEERSRAVISWLLAGTAVLGRFFLPRRLGRLVLYSQLARPSPLSSVPSRASLLLARSETAEELSRRHSELYKMSGPCGRKDSAVHLRLISFSIFLLPLSSRYEEPNIFHLVFLSRVFFFFFWTASRQRLAKQVLSSSPGIRTDGRVFMTGCWKTFPARDRRPESVQFLTEQKKKELALACKPQGNALFGLLVLGCVSGVCTPARVFS